ncbi:hypothetical protein LZ31DRAFT_313486 [Colletotrichum somersetense]|nr:hypothetical protein LZ31DRAFT_313486 [Colletotrichum somersetense]
MYSWQWQVCVFCPVPSLSLPLSQCFGGVRWCSVAGGGFWRRAKARAKACRYVSSGVCWGEARPGQSCPSLHHVSVLCSPRGKEGMGSRSWEGDEVGKLFVPTLPLYPSRVGRVK